MRTTIDIEIHPLNDCNKIELSKANKVSNQIISIITKALDDVDTSNVYFEITINTKS